MRYNSLILSLIFTFFSLFCYSQFSGPTVNSLPTVKLINSHCGKVYTDWWGNSAVMKAEIPSNPNPSVYPFFSPRFQFKVVNSSGVPVYQSYMGGNFGGNYHTCFIGNYSNMLCNTDYKVVVRWKPYFGHYGWSNWGDTCTITTPDCHPGMTEEVASPWCGSVISDWFQDIPLTCQDHRYKYKIKINNIPGNNFYEDSVESLLIWNPSNKFSLDQFQNTPSGSLSPNTTYEVRVTWKAYHRTAPWPGGVVIYGDWRPYGDVCLITTPEAIPDLVVLGSAGTVFDSASPWFINYSVSYTVGEAVIHDVVNTNTNDMLTQGFQQPSEIIVVTPGSGQADMPLQDPLFTVYPNPTSAIATLVPNNEIDYLVNVACFDANGSLLWEQKMENNRLLIDLQNNTPGLYHLKIFDVNNKLLDYKKLIKVISQP